MRREYGWEDETIENIDATHVSGYCRVGRNRTDTRPDSYGSDAADGSDGLLSSRDDGDDILVG